MFNGTPQRFLKPGSLLRCILTCLKCVTQLQVILSKFSSHVATLYREEAGDEWRDTLNNFDVHAQVSFENN